MTKGTFSSRASVWPITYSPRMSQISFGVGRSDLTVLPDLSALVSSRMMSLHSSTHSSQMNTEGPAISFLTSCWLLPQKEQYRSFSPPDFSVIFCVLKALGKSQFTRINSCFPGQHWFRHHRGSPALYQSGRM